MLVGYMRVSSTDNRHSVDLQRDALVAAGVDDRHLYSDKAFGARDNRPWLTACLDYLKAGDTLIVWKLDRLGRSLPHLLTIVTDLKARGVAFRSLTEQIDTTMPQGELLFSLFGALAQYERALTREQRGGRPPTLDPEKVEQIPAALDAGASKASVCCIFGVASLERPQVESILYETFALTSECRRGARSVRPCPEGIPHDIHQPGQQGGPANASSPADDAGELALAREHGDAAAWRAIGGMWGNV